jgi:hypothetical protein
MKKILPLAFATLFLVTGCSDSKTSTKEKEEIEVMDSTEKQVKEAAKDLEDQTEKVEKSLEKLDKEFKDTTN